VLVKRVLRKYSGGLSALLTILERDPPPLFRIIEFHPTGIELLRIELVTHPLTHLLVLFVRRVIQDLEQRLVAPWPAAILRRACALAAYASRIFPAFLTIRNLLQEDLVAPTVSEIIFVLRAVARFAQVGQYRDLPSGEDRLVTKIVCERNANLCNSVGFQIPDTKDMEVIIEPPIASCTATCKSQNE